MKKKYTKKLHDYRVSLMVKKIESRERPITGCCPAKKGFHYGDLSILNLLHKDYCLTCMEFVGVDTSRLRYNGDWHCPCWEFGVKEALIRTKAALKEYYK